MLFLYHPDQDLYIIIHFVCISMIGCPFNGGLSFFEMPLGLGLSAASSSPTCSLIIVNTRVNNNSFDLDRK